LLVYNVAEAFTAICSWYLTRREQALLASHVTQRFWDGVAPFPCMFASSLPSLLLFFKLFVATLSFLTSFFDTYLALLLNGFDRLPNGLISCFTRKRSGSRSRCRGIIAPKGDRFTTG
jgi:hypothetical protein